jgi:hypothetical protein
MCAGSRNRTKKNLSSLTARKKAAGAHSHANAERRFEKPLRLAKASHSFNLLAGKMNAAPLLNSVVTALSAVGLEAILIGNAAAALHGAPVTTLDFDFMFRETCANLGHSENYPS